MYCCLLLQIYLCCLWLLLCSRDTYLWRLKQCSLMHWINSWVYCKNVFESVLTHLLKRDEALCRVQTACDRLVPPELCVLLVSAGVSLHLFSDLCVTRLPAAAEREHFKTQKHLLTHESSPAADLINTYSTTRERRRRSLPSPGHTCDPGVISNSQQYIVWVKNTIFL